MSPRIERAASAMLAPTKLRVTPSLLLAAPTPGRGSGLPVNCPLPTDTCGPATSAAAGVSGAPGERLALAIGAGPASGGTGPGSLSCCQGSVHAPSMPATASKTSTRNLPEIGTIPLEVSIRKRKVVAHTSVQAHTRDRFEFSDQTLGRLIHGRSGRGLAPKQGSTLFSFRGPVDADSGLPLCHNSTFAG